MKKGGFLKRNNTLQVRTPLKTKKGFTKKISPLARTPMKRSRFQAKGNPSLQYDLDRIFSRYIRLMHANSLGWVQCVTCGIVRRWDDRMDAGHFIPRQHLATRYDLFNVFPQCKDCNRFHDGRIKEFSAYLTQVSEYLVEELKEKASQTIHQFPYKEKIQEFSVKLKELETKQSGIQY